MGLLEIKEGSQIASANIYLSLQDAQKLLAGEANGVNIVYLRLENPSLLTQVKSRIGKELHGVSVTSSDSFLELMGGVSKISDQFSLACLHHRPRGGHLSDHQDHARQSRGPVQRDRHPEGGRLDREGCAKAAHGGGLAPIVRSGVSRVSSPATPSPTLSGFSPIPVSTPWEINLMPAFARDTETAAAAAAVRLPVALSAGLTFAALALSLFAGGLASFFMGSRTARMKPVDILGNCDGTASATPRTSMECRLHVPSP